MNAAKVLLLSAPHLSSLEVLRLRQSILTSYFIDLIDLIYWKHVRWYDKIELVRVDGSATYQYHQC